MATLLNIRRTKMTKVERYESARAAYAKYGVDTDAAMAKLKEIPVYR